MAEQGTGINYIKQINGFWEKLSTEMNLKTSSGFVYMALLQVNNRTGWKTTFRAVRGDIMFMANIANVKTYYTCINELVEGGYISYKPGPNQHVAAEFKLELLYDAPPVAYPKNGTAHSEATGVTHGESDGTATGTILKPKNNKPKTAKEAFSPPSLGEVKIYFKEKGFSEEIADRAFNYYNEGDWKDTKGNQVINWKQKMISVWMKDENRINNTNEPAGYKVGSKPRGAVYH